MRIKFKQFYAGSRYKLLVASTLCLLFFGVALWYAGAPVEQPTPMLGAGSLATKLQEPSVTEPKAEPVRESVPRGSDPFQAHLSNQRSSANRPVVTVVTSSEIPNPGQDPFKTVLEAQATKQSQVGVSPFGALEKKP